MNKIMDKGHEQAAFVRRHLLGYPGCEEMLELIGDGRNAIVISLRYHFVPTELAPKVEIW